MGQPDRTSPPLGSKTAHPGKRVIATGVQLDYTGQKRLHRRWRSRGYEHLALVLDRVQNPLNVGSIVRTAAAERVRHIYLGGSASPDDSKAGKTAMGTQKQLTWSKFADGTAAVTAARADGLQIVGIELATTARPLYEINLTGPVALVVGSENHGLSKPVLARCDDLGFIPQLGRVGSLNVAAATAIAIYETRRQHWSPST